MQLVSYTTAAAFVGDYVNLQFSRTHSNSNIKNHILTFKLHKFRIGIEDNFSWNAQGLSCKAF